MVARRRLDLLHGRGRETAEEKAREKVKDDVFAYDENYQQVHLWRVRVATGEEERITEGDFSVLGYTLSRDGTMIAHHRAPDPLYGDAEKGEVWVMARRRLGRACSSRTTVSPRAAPSCPPTTGGCSSPPTPAPTWARATTTRTSSSSRPRAARSGSSPPARARASTRPPGAPTGRRSTCWPTRACATRSSACRRRGGEPTPVLEGDAALGGWSYSPKLDRHVFTRRTSASPGDVWTPATRRRARRRSPTSSTTWPPASASPGRRPSSGRARTASPWRGCSTIPWTTGRDSATRWWCRPTAGPPPATSSAARGARPTTCRCWPPSATSCSSPTTGGAPGTATTSCATWWGTTSTRPTWT